MYKNLKTIVEGALEIIIKDLDPDTIDDSPSLKGMCRERLKDHGYGAHDAHRLAIYDILIAELKSDEAKIAIPLINLAQNCGWWAPYQSVCFLQEKPSKILLQDDLSHAEGESAIDYRGGLTNVYSLWGVTVPRWLAETPYEKLELKKIMGITNADIRAIGLKRYGPERIVESGIGKVLEDKWEEEGYKLIDLSELFDQVEYAPFLYMQNPSVAGLIHCEGLPENIKSIEEAIKWSELRDNDEYDKLIHT